MDGGDTSQTLLLRKKKYVPWRCALVYEWLRCEPWRPWGWGETTRGPRRPARAQGGGAHRRRNSFSDSPFVLRGEKKLEKKSSFAPGLLFLPGKQPVSLPKRAVWGGAPNREFRGRKQSVWRHQTAPRPAGSHLEEHTVGRCHLEPGHSAGLFGPTRGQGPPVVRP